MDPSVINQSASGIQDSIPSSRQNNKRERSGQFKTNRYTLSNLNLKKGVAFDPNEPKLLNIENLPEDSPKKKLTEKGTYQGIIRVKNTDPNVDGEFKYMEIQNWWKTHKNILKRSPDDMPPINYEHD